MKFRNFDFHILHVTYTVILEIFQKPPTILNFMERKGEFTCWKIQQLYANSAIQPLSKKYKETHNN